MTEKEMLRQEIEMLKLQLAASQQQVALLTEMVQQSQRKQFGRSKETLPNKDQLSLFAANELKKNINGNKRIKPIKSRKERALKRVGHKADVLNQYPEEEVHIHLEEDKQNCQTCHHKLKDIGTTEVRRELKFVPAHFKTQVFLQHTYKCVHCSESSHQEVFIKPTVPAQAVPNGFGSSSLVTATISKKYEEKVPANRQELFWERQGLPLTRGVICNWHIFVCQNFFNDLVDAMHQELLAQPIIHADETHHQVLEMDKKKSYYWLLQSSKHAEHPITIYRHRPSRGQDELIEILDDYAGIIHCDMYSVYRSYAQSHETVKLSGCWAHLRRYFFEALPKNWSEEMPVYQIIEMIDDIFEWERDWANLTPEKRLKRRRRKLKPAIDELFAFIHLYEHDGLINGAFQTAVAYALNHREHFETFLSDGHLELSNNAAERSIKPLVMGRKNYLFSASVDGAESSGVLQSVIETAKLNGLDAYKYLEYLLDRLPTLYRLGQPDLADFMPWSDEVQVACRLIQDVKQEATA